MFIAELNNDGVEHAAIINNSNYILLLLLIRAVFTDSVR